jgi:hypothetical protein
MSSPLSLQSQLEDGVGGIVTVSVEDAEDEAVELAVALAVVLALAVSVGETLGVQESVGVNVSLGVGAGSQHNIRSATYTTGGFGGVES